MVNSMDIWFILQHTMYIHSHTEKDRVKWFFGCSVSMLRADFFSLPLPNYRGQMRSLSFCLCVCVVCVDRICPSVCHSTLIRMKHFATCHTDTIEFGHGIRYIFQAQQSIQYGVVWYGTVSLQHGTCEEMTNLINFCSSL